MKSINSATVWQFQDVVLERYCFAPNLSVPPHSHDEYQIGLTLCVPGEYQYRKATYIVPVGGLSVIHPEEVHIGRSLGTNEVTIITRKLYISSARMLQVINELTEYNPKTIPFISTPIISEQRLFGYFLNLHKTLGGTAPRLEQDSLLLFTLSQLVLRYAENPPLPRTYNSAHKAVERVREYIHEHFTDNISLSCLAQIAQLSSFHLCRLFATEVGLPPHKYQTQVRIAKAKTLLSRGVSLEQVALETGFSHQSHFGRHFKHLVGVTPGQYLANSNNVIDTYG